MIPIIVRLNVDAYEDVHCHYHVANCMVQVNRALPALSAFGVPFAGSYELPNWVVSRVVGVPAYEGVHWVANAEHLIRCYQVENGYVVAIEEIGDFFVSTDGQAIVQGKSEQGVSGAVWEEVILGPALILALALQGVFCLHASAVLIKGRLLVFVGESGQGKSTLAAYLGELPAFQWAVDDVFPLQVSEGHVRGYPWFPQLKRSPHQQMVAHVPHCVPIGGIYLLAEGDAVHSQSLGRKEGMLCLIQHTIATRLFAGKVLGQHMGDMGVLAGELPIKRLSYPRQWESLPTVAQLLEQEISG